MTVEVAYVLGLGRSGTTVFGRELARATDAVAGDEVMAVWQRGVVEDRVCSCGARFSACPHWAAVRATAPHAFAPRTAERVVDHLHRVMGVLGPVEACTAARRAALVDATPAAWFDAVAALYHGMAAVGGARPIVDTSKAPVLAWLLAHGPGVRVRTVVLVRDPRAVARSWGTPPALPEGAHPLPVLRPWQVAVVWALCNVAAERVHVALRGTAAGIFRYEDVVREPMPTVARAIAALGLAGAAQAADGSHAGGETSSSPVDVIHTMSGHPSVRFAPAATGIRRDAGVAASRRDGAGGGRAIVTVIDAPVLARFGYGVSESP